MALIHILTAAPRAGKTQAALSLAGDRVVIFCPSAANANPLVTAIPWAPAADLRPGMVARLQARYPRVRLVLRLGEAELLRRFETGWEGYTFVFDDVPALLPFRKDQQVFAEFASTIRHRGGSIIATTQYVRGVATPLFRALADRIDQVGPLVAEDEARILYLMGGSARFPNFKSFYSAIKNNPPYKLFPIKTV